MRKRRHIFLIVIVIIAAVLVVKAALFLTAKPKIVVDYQAKINSLSKPSDYDPNKNGLKYLIEASDLYTKTSLGEAQNLWPHEMNEVEISLLRQWVIANSKAFDAYRKAGECDYIWRKRKENSESSESDLSKWPEHEMEVRWCLFRNAKLKAFEGNFDEALESLLAAWKVAVKSTNPNYPLGWQMNILSDRRSVLDTAIDIVDVYKLPAADLEKWQKQWQKQFELDSYVPGFEGVRLEFYGTIQKTFVHKKDGSGRLYWNGLEKYVPTCDCVSTLDVLRIPFTGPTESDMRSMIDFMTARYKDLVMFTPSEVRYPEQQHVQAQDDYKRNNSVWGLLDYFVPPLNPFTTFYYRVKMRQDALVTILAILRFNEQHSNYPSNLADLVQQGFLTDLPRDPFSRSPMIYIQLDDDFELYSVGSDFADDGGRRGAGFNSLTGARYGDEVFWPPLRKGRRNIKYFDREIFERFGIH